MRKDEEMREWCDAEVERQRTVLAPFLEEMSRKDEEMRESLAEIERRMSV